MRTHEDRRPLGPACALSILWSWPGGPNQAPMQAVSQGMSHDDLTPDSEQPLAVPRVSPIGLVEYPDDFTASPREISRGLRRAVWALLIFFAVATVATSILSVGAYCLTSDGADTRSLHAGPLFSEPQAEPSE